jgi:hypothetical protein
MHEYRLVAGVADSSRGRLREPVAVRSSYKYVFFDIKLLILPIMIYVLSENMSCKCPSRYLNVKYKINWVHAIAQLIEVLRYKLEGHGFDSRWCHWNFSLT